MEYLEFLGRVHELLDPPAYLEIGVRHGDSLALARSRAVGIDPAYELRTALPDAVELFAETSDEYFDRERPLDPLGGERVGLAFIDGMHLVEFALRDFINVERHCDWTSVVVFDDVLPREGDEATRRRRTRAWTGDVYKISQILTRHRPGLVCVRVDTAPTGLLLVLGLDPASSVLDERYDEIVRNAVAPDPQPVPRDVLERRGAVAPDTVLEASFWSLLRDARAAGIARGEGLSRLRRTVRRDLGRRLTLQPLARVLARA
jgi:methyltransferase family protein